MNPQGSGIHTMSEYIKDFVYNGKMELHME